MPALDWIGKRAVINHHREVPTRLLHCESEISGGDPEAGSLLVEGDNLEALKALLPYYAGRVKCIYIDPPFNTGSEDWIYNDNLSDPEIIQWLNRVVGPEGEDLCRHDKWLCMIYPRLRLLRDFLTEDGTLFVHVDANELDHAIYVCDEIFGRRNQSGIITFKQASATGHKAINPGLVTVTNYILVYSANKSKWKPKRLFTGRARDKRYSSFIKGRDLPVDRWQFTTLLKGFAAAHDATDREARALLKLEPERLDDFVLANAKAVVQFATPDFDAVGEATRKAILLSKERPKEVVLVEREGHSDIFLVNGLRILFYADKLKIVDGETVAGEPLTNLWDDILSNNIHKEGGVEFPKGKKPESLLKRCLELSTSPGDLVLDSFLGSGTTAAVAMKMGRRFLGVERGEHAKSHAAVRLRSVIEGEQGGISPAVAWRGGSGFRYCILGNPLFDEFGAVTETVGFGDLAAFVFFAETGSPIPRKASAENPLLGCFGQRSVYLLWSPESAGFPNEQAGNVLTAQTLQQLPQAPPEGEHRVIYAEGCTVPRERLAQAGITFKQIPYQVIAT